MARTLTTNTADGGTLSIEQVGGGFRITRTRGWKETPEARASRIAAGPHGGVHSDKTNPSRSRVKQDLRSGKW